MFENGPRNEIDQRILQCLGRKTHPLPAPQAGLTKDVAFTETAEQLPGAQDTLYRTAAVGMQNVAGRDGLAYGRARHETGDLHVADGIDKHVAGQYLEGR